MTLAGGVKSLAAAARAVVVVAVAGYRGPAVHPLACGPLSIWNQAK